MINLNHRVDQDLYASIGKFDGDPKWIDIKQNLKEKRWNRYHDRSLIMKSG